MTFLIFDVSDREVAHLVLRTSTHRLQTDQHLTYIRIHIWHTNITHLDSLFIQFDPMIPSHVFQVYLETPMGRDWDVTIAEVTGNRFAYQFPELGVYGTGTLNVGFFIQKDLDLSIRVTTRMMLHDTTFPVVTQQYAIASTEIDS